MSFQLSLLHTKNKSFDFVIKTTPAAMMIKKAAGIKKASGNQKEISGKITVDQLREIAEYKMPDLNANDVEAAMRIVAGTAKTWVLKLKVLNKKGGKQNGKIR